MSTAHSVRSSDEARRLSRRALGKLALAGAVGGFLQLFHADPGVAHEAVAAAESANIPPQQVKYRLSDCHLHLVDFRQRTDGIRAALAAMDRCGVDHAMLCGMPVVKQWSVNEPVQPGYYLDDDARCYWYSATDVLVARAISSLRERDRKRFHPFICGFNGADRNAVDHIRRMIEWYPEFWQGIGEVMARHDDLTALTYGETARANSNAMDPIFRLAAELDLPVAIHSNISSVWKREPLYLDEMEGAFRTHPRTRFLWCHAGVSRRVQVPTLVEVLRRVLQRYPTVSIDLSWVVFEEYLVQNGRPTEAWVRLLEEFPTRFLVGSDKVGKFDDYENETLKYNLLLDALRPETARRVARENFLALLPKKPARLPATNDEGQAG